MQVIGIAISARRHTIWTRYATTLTVDLMEHAMLASATATKATMVLHALMVRAPTWTAVTKAHAKTEFALATMATVVTIAR